MSLFYASFSQDFNINVKDQDSQTSRCDGLRNLGQSLNIHWRTEGPGEPAQEACLGLLFYGWAGSLDGGWGGGVGWGCDCGVSCPAGGWGEKDKPMQEIIRQKCADPWRRSLGR